MTTDLALPAARLLLAAVFAAAAAAKLLDRAATRRTLADFGLPARLARPGAVGLPLAEAAVAVLLLPPPTASWGAAAALVLLLVFVLAMARSLARGRRPSCNCFGRQHSTPVGGLTLARNGGLAAVAGWVLLMGPGASLDGTALLILAFGAQAWLSSQLLRQNGRLLNRIREVEERLAPAQAGDGTRVAVIGRGEPQPNRVGPRGHGIGEVALQRDAVGSDRLRSLLGS
jgi:hypothetical protein